MSLRVLSPGTISLLVDGGRPRTRGLGVPVGGPADAASLILGNALVGNPPFAAGLEITLSGPTLVADSDVGICVFGAPFQIYREDEPIAPNQTFTLKEGQPLRIGGTPSGCRAYVCVPGGFHEKSVLGSVTGFEPLNEGDVLTCELSTLPGRSLEVTPATCLTLPPNGKGDAALFRRGKELRPLFRSPIRCLPGPQADWFDESFFTNTYRVTPASNRMGIRLDGPALSMPKRELVSEPVAPGAVQITNDGKPIVLGVDGQTIGGYPKVAHVISADLDALGQLRPGDEVCFRKVSENEAEAAAAESRELLRQLLCRVSIALM